MRLVSFGEAGRERPGIVVAGGVLTNGAGAGSPSGAGAHARIIALATLRPSWPGSWRGVLEAGLEDGLAAVVREGEDLASAGPSRDVQDLSQVRLGPPLPDPTKIVAIGLNYRDHALEQKKEPPKAPLLFAKAPSCLIGPADPIRLPDPAIEDQVDAEAELCLVIGRAARNVTPEEARAYIFGYTIMNDVSGRASQYGDKQWFRGKSFDTFAPCGPWIVTRDELPEATGLSLEADWGGRPMQRGNTRDLIFPPEALVSYVSRMMTLQPGDLITTGTPAGVGVFRDPPVFLRHGDEVVVRLEGVGEIRNPVL